MPTIEVDIPVQVDGETSLNASQFNALVAAVLASLSADDIIAAVGTGNLLMVMEGALAGLTPIVMENASAAQMVGGTDEGTLAWTAKAMALIGAPEEIEQSGSSVTLNGYNGRLVKRMELTDDIDTIAADLPEHGAIKWEVYTGATGAKITWPTLGIWRTPLAELNVAANREVHIGIVKRGDLLVANWSAPMETRS